MRQTLKCVEHADPADATDDWDLLAYWCRRALECAACAIFVRKYSPIPGATAREERIFSGAGTTVSCRRGGLLPAHVEMLEIIAQASRAGHLKSADELAKGMSQE